jgi:osmotically-inducible protein OsmY
MRPRAFAVFLALSCASGLAGATDRAAGQSAQAARDAVAAELAGERDFRPITVTLDDQGRIVLGGEVSLLWTEQEALRLASRAAGERDVVSELTVAAGLDDATTLGGVERAIRNYEYLTVFDYVSGSIRDGVVTLTGQVTSLRDISGDLAERVSRVRGVRELRNELEILPSFRADDEIRGRLARAIFSRPGFERFARMSNPPFRLIVRNGIVTLRGYVETQAEYIEMQQIASQIPGILRIENRLETLR